MTEAVVSLMAGISVYALLARRTRSRDEVARRRLTALAGPVRPRKRRARLSLVKVVEAVARPLPVDKVGLEEKIQNSGLSTSAEFVIGLSAAMAAVGAVVGTQLPLPGILAVPMLAFAGYRAPHLLIGAKSKARAKEIAEDLPEMVDLLAVCTQAGLNLQISLRRVANRGDRALGEEMRRAVAGIDLGLRTSAALSELADRIPVEDLRSLVGILENSERFGTRVSSSLQDFSKDLRAKMRREAEERARKAPVKLLFPLVFLILPGFILLTVVPLVAGTFKSLGF